jgi:hypothetical protein
VHLQLRRGSAEIQGASLSRSGSAMATVECASHSDETVSPMPGPGRELRGLREQQCNRQPSAARQSCHVASLGEGERVSACSERWGRCAVCLTRFPALESQRSQARCPCGSLLQVLSAKTRHSLCHFAEVRNPSRSKGVHRPKRVHLSIHSDKDQGDLR